MSAPLLSFRPESPGVHFDLDKLIASRALAQANSGGGKSRLLRYMVEQLYGRVQIVILDPEGEFATLRERHDFLLAGVDGDVPADPKTAKLLARRLLELNASAIVDLYDLKLQERRRYVRAFLEELVHAPRKLWRPLLVIIDEAHAFAPQTSDAESLAAVIDLCTLGRKRGFAAVLATQRISKLHKDAAAELHNKLIGRTGLDVDMKRAGDELGLDKDGRLQLRDMQPGTFYAFGPAIDAAGVTLVRSGDVKTTHPEPGAVAPPAPPAPAAIRKLLGQMTDLEREAAEELRTIEDRDREIARLKSDLRRANRAQPVAETVVDERAIARAVAAAEKALRQENAQLRAVIEKRERELGRWMGRVQVGAAKLLTEIERAPSANGDVPPASSAEKSDDLYLRVTKDDKPTVRATRPAPVPRASRAAPAASGSALPVGEHAVLTAACQYPDGVTREQLTILTGYKRSSRDAYIQRLRGKELVDVAGGLVVAADGAEEHLGSFEPLPTGSALQQYWLDRLPQGERAVFQVLLDQYPQWVTRDEISEETDYKRSSRDAYVQRLKARQIIEVAGDVRAAAFLFDEARP